jgi:hypothetical protein
MLGLLRWLFRRSAAQSSMVGKLFTQTHHSRYISRRDCVFCVSPRCSEISFALYSSVKINIFHYLDDDDDDNNSRAKKAIPRASVPMEESVYVVHNYLCLYVWWLADDSVLLLLLLFHFTSCCKYINYLCDRISSFMCLGFSLAMEAFPSSLLLLQLSCHFSIQYILTLRQYITKYTFKQTKMNISIEYCYDFSSSRILLTLFYFFI